MTPNALKFRLALAVAILATSSAAYAAVSPLTPPPQLPPPPPGGIAFSPHSLIQRMQGDKKAERGRLTFVLARGIGQAFVAKGVASGVVETTLMHALAA